EEDSIRERNVTGVQTCALPIFGASRTDSGVHALGNVAVFDTNSTIPPERMSYALNQRLPEDIVVVRSEEVPEDWHPRYQDRIRKIGRASCRERVPQVGVVTSCE